MRPFSHYQGDAIADTRPVRLAAMPPVQSSVVDSLDRATSYKEEESCRQFLKLIGFHPSHRYGLGINSEHVHELAHACQEGVRQHKYGAVDVIRVPAKALDQFRDVNKKKCENDKLMPRFSPEMKFACLTRTHFTHACKLNSDGARKLYNEEAGALIDFNDNQEIRKIMEEGVKVTIYKEEMWDDMEAIYALMSADNEHASVAMVEDEVQCQCRIETAISYLRSNGTEDKHMTPTQVFEAVKSRGLRYFSDDQTKAYIGFRLSIIAPVGDLFLMNNYVRTYVRTYLLYGLGGAEPGEPSSHALCWNAAQPSGP